MRLPFVLGVALLSTPVLAQPAADTPSSRRPSTQEGWSGTVGVAPVVSPAWEGASNYVFSIFPDLRISHGDTFFASIPEGVGWNAVNADGLKVGPIVKLRFGREEDGSGSPFAIAGDSDALVGLGDIDAAVELGGFVEKRFGRRQQWRGRGEVRRGFGGHEGVVADVSLSYQARAGRTIVNIGPRATLASSSYTRTYFGIDPVQSQRSGLATYRPKGGLVSYGVGASVVHPLTQRTAITAFSSLQRLGGLAKDAPHVSERGSATQFTAGVGYGVRF